jgi:hypothetical protein
MSEPRIPSLQEIDERIAALSSELAAVSAELDKWRTFRALAMELGAAQPQPSAPPRTGLYAGMSIKESVIHYLLKKGAPASTSELVKVLRDGGKESESKSFYRTVFNMLTHASERKVPQVVKIDSKWALPEWNKL